MPGDDLLTPTCVARAPSPAKRNYLWHRVPFWKQIPGACSLVTVKPRTAEVFLRPKHSGRWRPPRTIAHSMSTKASPLDKYRYRRRLPHLQNADADLFITFCTGGRRILREPARDLVMEHCLREDGLQALAGEGARPTQACPTLEPRIHLHAVVVMPDHVHLLLAPLRDADGWP